MSWRTVNLGELVDNYSVRAKDHNADTSSLEFCGVSNNEGITLSKYAAEDKADDYKIIEKDCFAYNPYRINVGSIGLLESDTVGLISPAYVVFKPKPKSIIPQLLLKFLKSSEGLRQIKMHARGTVRQALRFEDLCKIELSIPDYDSQLEFFKRIEETEIETSVLNNEFEHQLSLVKQLRQAFLREAMQGKLVPQDPNDEPASVLLEKIKAEKEQLIKEKKIKKEKTLPPISEEEIPFEIPENWMWCRLGEICTLITDGKHGDSKNDKNSGYYFLSAKDIQNGRFVYENARQITYDDFIETHKRTNLEPGDLCVVNTGATIGKTAFAPENELTRNTTFQKSVAIIKVLKQFTKMKFVEYFIKYETPSLLKTSRGSAINNLLLGDLKNVLFPMPSQTNQISIVAKLDELMLLCDNLEASIKESKAQNEALLQQVLREALEVR